MEQSPIAPDPQALYSAAPAGIPGEPTASLNRPPATISTAEPESLAAGTTYTITEVGKRIGKSSKTVRRLINTGKLTASLAQGPFGPEWRITEAALEQLFAGAPNVLDEGETSDNTAGDDPSAEGKRSLAAAAASSSESSREEIQKLRKQLAAAQYELEEASRDRSASAAVLQAKDELLAAREGEVSQLKSRVETLAQSVDDLRRMLAAAEAARDRLQRDRLVGATSGILGVVTSAQTDHAAPATTSASAGSASGPATVPDRSTSAVSPARPAPAPSKPESAPQASLTTTVSARPTGSPRPVASPPGGGSSARTGTPMAPWTLPTAAPASSDLRTAGAKAGALAVRQRLAEELRALTWQTALRAVATALVLSLPFVALYIGYLHEMHHLAYR